MIQLDMPRGRVAQDPKRCTMCKEMLPRTEFYKTPSNSPNSVEPRCKKCCVLRAAAYGKTEHGRSRKAESCRRYMLTDGGKKARLRNNLKNSVGLTVEQYASMLESQDGKCAICKVENGVPRRRLAADHCHVTGTFRGVLCGRCNMAIGLLNDDVARIASAMEYLVSRRLPVV